MQEDYCLQNFITSMRCVLSSSIALRRLENESTYEYVSIIRVSGSGTSMTFGLFEPPY